MAQPAAPNSLRHAVEAAWKRSTQLAASAGRVGVARATHAAAQSLWAAPPALELSNRGDPFTSVSGQRETEVGIAWPLLLPGQRSARSASAAADLGAADAAESAAKLSIAGEVREAAWAFHARTAELALAEAQSKALQDLAKDVERRVAAGDLARSDALAARAEALAASASAREASLRRDVARARWSLLTGSAEVPEASEPSTNGMLEQHPEIIHSRGKVEAARKRLELVRSTRRDPPELLVQYRNEIAASGLPSQNSIGLAVRIPFGTDDRNLPREASAISDVDVAQAEERRTRERLEAELAVAQAATAAAEQQLAMEESRAALLRERAQLMERSFRAGETSLPELLRVISAATHAEGSFTRQRTELGLARARARQAAGVLP